MIGVSACYTVYDDEGSRSFFVVLGCQRGLSISRWSVKLGGSARWRLKNDDNVEEL